MTDPTTPELVKEALASQRRLLGRHDTMLQGIMESLQLSTQQLNHPSASSAGEGGTTPSVSSPPETAPFPLLCSVVKEPFVPTPEPYSGDLGSCSQFILNCSLVFELQASSYPTDWARIAFVINLLHGRAAKWATALWNSASPVLSSFERFSAELRRVFDHTVKGREAMCRLLALSQGSQSAANYSIEFRILASECGWDESALMGIYLKGLSEQLKDELAVRDESTSLEELISVSIQLDQGPSQPAGAAATDGTASVHLL